MGTSNTGDDEMIKPTGRTLWVDMGPVQDQLGANLIVTPDRYKRIQNIGIILAVGDRCRMFNKKDVRKKVIIGTWNRGDCRFKTDPKKEKDKKAHWHFRIPEHKIEAMLE